MSETLRALGFWLALALVLAWGASVIAGCAMRDVADLALSCAREPRGCN